MDGPERGILVADRPARGDMRAAFAIASGLMFVAGCAPGETAEEPAGGASQTLDPIKSGAEFLTPQTRALQDDDFANPGFLWVDKGHALFEQVQDRVPSCASCHDGGDALIGASARYPAVDETTGDLLNIEGRINACRTRHQDQPALEYENEDLLALTAYVASLSRGTPIAVETGGNASRAYESGREYFFTRRGQFNLSCSNCHDANWGRKLRGDTFSQLHGN